jgi:serine/threonine protein kinase
MEADETVDPLGWVGGTVAGKYRVDEVVAEGGFGVVYRAQHLGFDSRVALKCLKLPAKLEGAEREKFLAAFLAEGKLLHQLSRETVGIVQALDAGADVSPSGTWTPYLALEWLEGSSLQRDLAVRERDGLPCLPLGEAIALLDPAARALAVAHQRGVVHRDIKPANLFVARIGDRSLVKVVDFGIAKVMTETGSLTQALKSTGASLQAFTPAYGAPEQFDRVHYGATGPWTDVFALALVLVELLSGRQALDGADSTQYFISAIHPDRRPTPRHCGVAISDSVEAVMLRAVAVDPRNRLASAGEFWDALELAASDGTAPREPPPAPRALPAGDTIREGPRPGTGQPTADEAPHATTGQATMKDAPQAKPASEALVMQPPSGRERRSRLFVLVGAGLAVAAASFAGIVALSGRNDAEGRLRPVPGAASPSAQPTAALAASGHYTRRPCGSIHDASSDLEWFVGPDRNTSWDEASAWTAALTACGAGWRMPTVEELRTLYDPRHTAGTGYVRDGRSFPARLDPLFASIGGGSWVWSGGALMNAQAVAYNFFTGGPAPMARDGSAPGGLPRFTTRAFAVRGHARTTESASAAATDGSDVRQPSLPVEDTGFVDTRGGWGWGDKCWIHIRAQKWGWAKAECDSGMMVADPSAPQPRASLLYNEGLIAKATGDIDGAQTYFTYSLELRENAEVRAALDSLGR